MGLNFSKQFLKQNGCRLLKEQRWKKGTLTMPLSVICADPWTNGSSRPRLSNNLGTCMKKPTSLINMIGLYPQVTLTAQRWLWFPLHYCICHKHFNLWEKVGHCISNVHKLCVDLLSPSSVKETGTLLPQCTTCLLSTQLPTCGEAVGEQQQAGWLHWTQWHPVCYHNVQHLPFQMQPSMFYTVQQGKEASNNKYKSVNCHKKMTVSSPLPKIVFWGMGNKIVFQMFK